MCGVCRPVTFYIFNILLPNHWTKSKWKMDRVDSWVYLFDFVHIVSSFVQRLRKLLSLCDVCRPLVFHIFSLQNNLTKYNLKNGQGCTSLNILPYCLLIFLKLKSHFAIMCGVRRPLTYLSLFESSPKSLDWIKCKVDMDVPLPRFLSYCKLICPKTKWAFVIMWNKAKRAIFFLKIYFSQNS
jgi:hypothetical protein